MSRGEYAFGGILPGVTRAGACGGPRLAACGEVPECERIDKYYK